MSKCLQTVPDITKLPVQKPKIFLRFYQHDCNNAARRQHTIMLNVHVLKIAPR